MSATSEVKRDETMPDGKWAFDGAVTDAFDDMLCRSIPDYENMRRLCFEIGSSFVRDGTAVIDLGCSRGEALAPFVNRFGATVRYLGIEVSAPMLAAARERFAGYVSSGIVSVVDRDLRSWYPPERASLTLCVLTLQFVPIEHRQRLLRQAFRATVPGGALILVEKVLGATAEIDALLVERYLAMKAANGYTRDQIDRKKLALEGVLVPVTSEWNCELLRQAGFQQIDCIWRVLNFAGWLAVREAA